MDGRMEYVKRTKLQISFSPTNWLKYKKERHNKMEELLSEGEKEIVKLHTSVSFENTSCKNVGSQKNFISVELNKDGIVFSWNQQKLQVEVFLGWLIK